eukprot:15451926-Alexandrium_andersonii.AAC.1
MPATRVKHDPCPQSSAQSPRDNRGEFRSAGAVMRRLMGDVKPALGPDGEGEHRSRTSRPAGPA